MTGALVLGKFYPPHLGHIGLIERAAVEADRVTVVVMAALAETIPLADRIAWLEEATAHLPAVRVIGVRNDAPVDYVGEAAWIANTAQLKAVMRQHGISAPDVVVSSEPYGTELARRLGARAVSHDPERRAVPVSGSAVRAALAGSWHLLPEATRLGLATRVIVVGAESTGTTTLADDLVAHYRAGRYPDIRPVPEYGREFTYLMHARAVAQAAAAGAPAPGIDDLVWMPPHFDEIAREQTAREQSAALAAPLVIADTDALATTIWERRYIGADSHASAGTATTGSLPRRHLYLVTDHVGVPFEQDGWRDGEHVRPAMTGWFVDELESRGFSWILMRGDRATRAAYAIEAIDGILAERERFGGPPWAADLIDTATPSQPLIAVDVVPLRYSPATGLVVGTSVRQFEPFAGAAALPGVLLDTGELLSDAAARALSTKGGVASGRGTLRPAGTFDSRGRDPREHAISIAWVSVLPPGVLDTMDWAEPTSRDSPLPFDHDEIVAAALVEVRHHLWSDAELTRALTGEEFTTRDAAAIEQALNGARPHPGNLTRALAADERLERAGDHHDGERGRPAARWRWLSPP